MQAHTHMCTHMHTGRGRTSTLPATLGKSTETQRPVLYCLGTALNIRCDCRKVSPEVLGAQ